MTVFSGQLPIQFNKYFLKTTKANLSQQIKCYVLLLFDLKWRKKLFLQQNFFSKWRPTTTFSNCFLSFYLFLRNWISSGWSWRPEGSTPKFWSSRSAMSLQSKTTWRRPFRFSSFDFRFSIFEFQKNLFFCFRFIP